MIDELEVLIKEVLDLTEDLAVDKQLQILQLIHKMLVIVANESNDRTMVVFNNFVDQLNNVSPPNG